jgi:hypothetical protein
MMRQTEYPHNKPAQVREYIVAALALVDDLDPPDDLRGPVFAKAADLYSSKQVVLEQVGVLDGGFAMPRGR